MIQTKTECIGCFAMNGELHHSFFCPAHGNHVLAREFRRRLVEAAERDIPSIVRIVDVGGEQFLPVYGEPGQHEKWAIEALGMLKEIIKNRTVLNERC